MGQVWEAGTMASFFSLVGVAGGTPGRVGVGAVLSHPAWPGPCTPAPCLHQAAPQSPASYLWTLKTESQISPSPVSNSCPGTKPRGSRANIPPTTVVILQAELASGPLHWLFPLPFPFPTTPSLTSFRSQLSV